MTLKTSFFHSEKESRKATLIEKLCIILTATLIIASSLLDQLGIMKHLWIAGLSAFFIFHLNSIIILPAISKQMFATDSNFRANS